MEFLYRPEYIEKGQIFVFREGRTRGLGIITELLE
jgi:translation elongation factor 1A GTP binding domain family